MTRMYDTRSKANKKLHSCSVYGDEEAILTVRRNVINRQSKASFHRVRAGYVLCVVLR